MEYLFKRKNLTVSKLDTLKVLYACCIENIQSNFYYLCTIEKIIGHS